jgi:hypothetical protein
MRFLFDFQFDLGWLADVTNGAGEGGGGGGGGGGGEATGGDGERQRFKGKMTWMDVQQDIDEDSYEVSVPAFSKRGAVYDAVSKSLRSREEGIQPLIIAKMKVREKADVVSQELPTSLAMCSLGIPSLSLVAHSYTVVGSLDFSHRILLAAAAIDTCGCVCFRSSRRSCGRCLRLERCQRCVYVYSTTLSACPQYCP